MHTIMKNVFKFLGEGQFQINFWSSLFSGLVVSGGAYVLVSSFTNFFKSPISVLVHEGFFLNNREESVYFVKVTNLSTNKIYTITHIYIQESNKELDLINPKKILPHKLEPSEQWETWFYKSQVGDHNRIYKNVRIVFSNGKIYKSKRNFKVRKIGHIA